MNNDLKKILQKLEKREDNDDARLSDISEKEYQLLLKRNGL